MRPLPFGARIEEDGSLTVRLHAPAEPSVSVETWDPAGTKETASMARTREGVHSARFSPGSVDRYQFRLGDGKSIPDPWSRFQPEGLRGASAVWDPRSFEWMDGDWKGRPSSEVVLYELHVGTFTDEGTFGSAIDKLDSLAALGVTAIQIMPVAETPGRNWGYDGVLPFSPSSKYGTPDDLKRLVQAAHEREMMVLLDVVYNHFGPEGNYLPRHSPDFFRSDIKTPWGDALNYSNPRVRELFLENACYWISEFRMDGLRLDAFHEVHDESTPHFLVELCARLRSEFSNRVLALVVEYDGDARPFLEE